MARPLRPRPMNPVVARANLAIVLAFSWLWLTPLCIFWSAVWGFTRPPGDSGEHLAPSATRFLVASALCLAPFLLPPAYYAAWEGRRAARIYEALGTRVFRRFATNGDLVNRWGRRRDASHRVVRDRESAEAWAREARAAERNHLVFLLMGLFSTAYAASIGWIGWTIALAITNVIFNAFPIGLQRYNRLRIARLAAR